MSKIPEHLKFGRSITVADLISQFDLCLLAGSPDVSVFHVSTPKTAVSGSFLSIYEFEAAAGLPVGEAFICLTTNDIAETIKQNHPNATVLVCEKPRRISAQILTQFFLSDHKADLSGADTASVDPSSFIHPDAVIGPYAVIGPDCYIESGVVIGAHVVLEREVHLAENCRIEAHCWLAHTVFGATVKVGQNSVIGKHGFGFDGKGADALFIPHIGRVVIGEGCNIGSGVAIDRGVIEDTFIGSYVMIDNLVHIAHNVCIGDNTIILGQAGIAGSVTIEPNCVIGGQVGIADHVHLCEGVTIASKSGVTKDISQPGKYAGFPAEPARSFWAKKVALRRLSDQAKKSN